MSVDGTKRTCRRSHEMSVVRDERTLLKRKLRKVQAAARSSLSVPRATISARRQAAVVVALSPRRWNAPYFRPGRHYSACCSCPKKFFRPVCSRQLSAESRVVRRSGTIASSMRALMTSGRTQSGSSYGGEPTDRNKSDRRSPITPVSLRATSPPACHARGFFLLHQLQADICWRSPEAHINC